MSGILLSPQRSLRTHLLRLFRGKVWWRSVCDRCFADRRKTAHTCRVVLLKLPQMVVGTSRGRTDHYYYCSLCCPSWCFLEGERPKTSNRPKWVSEPNLVENLYQVSRARFGYYIRHVAFWEKSIPSNLDQLHKSFSRVRTVGCDMIGTLHPTHPNVRHTLESPAISTHSSTEAFSRESLVEICLRSVLCRPTENGTHMPLVKTKESRGRSPKSFFCWQAHVPNLVEDHSCEGCNAPISPSETWRA